MYIHLVFSIVKRDFGRSLGLNLYWQGEAFKKRYLELHEKMDTSGILALWAEDGVDLMPGSAPMVGRKNIAAWLEDILAKMPGFKVTKQEVDFRDIHVCGDWASEWATEHQMVQPPDGKPQIDSYGKMALVVHREASGEWRVQQEMWNAGPKPGEWPRGNATNLALPRLGQPLSPSRHFLKQIA